MNIRSLCDLHIHSHYSDGTMSPAGIVGAAAREGLAAVSVTDHDTTAGQPEALAVGRETGVEVVTGIEFSVEQPQAEIHILGYLFDPRDRALLERLEVLERSRRQRVRTMIELLRGSGVDVSAEEIFAAAGGGTIGRPHVAKILLRRGIVATFQEAFDRFIGNGRSCYVPKDSITLEQVVGLIRGAGGVAVWAHPGYAIRDGALLQRIVDAGIAGLEAWHPNHSQQITALVIDEARRRGLVCTGGSDYHFDEAMKSTLGGIAVPYEAVRRLRDVAGGHLS